MFLFAFLAISWPRFFLGRPFPMKPFSLKPPPLCTVYCVHCTFATLLIARIEVQKFLFLQLFILSAHTKKKPFPWAFAELRWCSKAYPDQLYHSMVWELLHLQPKALQRVMKTVQVIIGRLSYTESERSRSLHRVYDIVRDNFYPVHKPNGGTSATSEPLIPAIVQMCNMAGTTQSCTSVVEYQYLVYWQ